MNNLKDVLEGLKSAKVTDRQHALQTVRDVFAKDKVVATFHLSQNGKATSMAWFVVFDALLRALSSERTLLRKASSTGAATRRISETASTIRWLTERSVRFLTMKTVSYLITELVQMLPADKTRASRLFQPVALDFAKALKCLLSYTPHLDHLGETQWIKLMEISFNVILDDPFTRKISDFEDPADCSTPVVDEDDEMFVDSANDTEPGPSNVATKGNKRLRGPTPVPILKSPNAKSKSRRHFQTSVTSEQVEFASILSILLTSPAAPILSNHEDLPAAILNRLQRFLERYPADSSLLYDYISILSATLDHLSLNKKHEVEVFARSTWTGLVGLWGTKDKRMKEGLVVVLRHLYQFVICPSYSENANLPPFDYTDGIGRLWRLLDAEADNKWGVDGLSLDALRFEIAGSTDNRSFKEEAFIAKTFRAGWNFDTEQALYWAILELRADCTGKLFQLSESMQHSTPIAGSSRNYSKRVKLENPVASLLHSIQTAIRVRNYHLQTLLFFIDRHWSLVHDSQKQEIIDTLLQFVAIEETTVQSWVFLNFAAIAHAESSRIVRKATDVPYALDSTMWDSIWTHAIRRANAPVICRAACHAGQAILTSFYSHVPQPSQVFLTSSRVLSDIETFAKDMDVQGPSYPFDAVCIFLSHCLIVASQDARLYRMHLEDTVLNWFIGSWKLTRNRTKMALYAIIDILRLLETICGLAKHIDLNFRPLLPKSEIVESMVRDNKTQIIRNFLLYATIPTFAPASDIPRATEHSIPGANINKMDEYEKILVPPRGKERRISSFFFNMLEPLCTEWESYADGKNNAHPTAELARQSLDITIGAITFESLLFLNGVSPNRQVLQISSKVMTIVVSLLEDPSWSTSEKLLVLQGLEILIPVEATSNGDAFRDALSLPCQDSGIKERTLKRLLAVNREKVKDSRSDHVKFLRLLWQNVELQDTLEVVSKTSRTILKSVFTGPSSSNGQAKSMEDRDGFGPIRTVNMQGSTSSARKMDDDRPMKHIIEICVGVLACGPFLQSLDSIPTRDKDLAKLILSSADNQPEEFCLVCPAFFSRVRQGTLALPVKYLDGFLEKFGSLLGVYSYSRSEPFQCICLELLNCCLGVWTIDDSAAREVHNKFIQLCDWLANTFEGGKMRSWILRDAFIRFMDKYLSEDPTQESWSSSASYQTEEDYRKRLPASLLPLLNKDPDIRVRFRAALINARLYSLTTQLETDPIVLYTSMKTTYVENVHDYERMLTRILSLGNIMIVSSAVRRGPYWHLLETFNHSQQYTSHIEAVLTGVAQRLGLPSLSALFKAYASQIAYSIRAAGADITTFPPHVLGYRDRRQSVQAAFRLFTPMNILNNGRTQFENHCKMLQKSVEDGLQDCFGEIVGLCIASWLHKPVPEQEEGNLYEGNDKDEIVVEEEISKSLEEYLKGVMFPLEPFWAVFEKNVDSIVATILQCLGDQDFSEGGPIVADLQSINQGNKPKPGPVFSSLVVHRSLDTFKPHQYNLPSFCTKTILKSFLWIDSQPRGAISESTTFHVLHLLMDSIHNTPLVNEQHRLINAMALWMAYRRQDLESLPVLNTVIHCASSFFAQSDLARSAQSILEVAFHYYRTHKFSDDSATLENSPLSNFLVRICCIAHDYTSNSDDPSIQEMGKGLLDWIDQQIYLLSKVSIFKNTIARALAAWPCRPSSELLPIYEEIMLGDLAAILEDHHLSSNKFRLVRRIKEKTLLRHDQEAQFSEKFFWRLKECMPSPDRLQDEDIAAFTELLSMNYGKISSFSPEQPDLHAPRARQRRMFKKKGTVDGALAQDAITLGLLVMLQDDDPVRVSNAYESLKLTMSISSGDLRLIPTEYRDEVRFFANYKRLPVQRAVPNVKDMLNSEVFLESAKDFKQWVSLITVLLSDTLAVVDPFYAQLTSILTTDAAFAEEVLPILVYTMLALQNIKKLTHVAEPLRPQLSKYFTAILLSTHVDLSCVRCIVDIALYLRYFTLKTNDALAYNKWLDMDYAILARSAVLCGAYTTALLFVEITSEQHDDRHDAMTEQVLYEIYAHIDEPDGFYGIKTNNLQQFLIRRLHHEKQWDKAFRFHGAALEAGNSRTVEEEGLLESFHYFGFDHLAIDTLRNLPGQTSSESLSSTSMNYKLAWRTETWDLPDHPKDSASAAFYRSLRAVYRERDPRLVDGIIHSAFLEEMSLLRSLGSENLAEIRTVSQDLMCLGQILQWRQGNIQSLLKTEDISLASWKEFVTIDPTFQFSDLESLMATRISLVRSVRQKEERQQIGTVIRPLVKGLKDIEKNCLLRLSEAARASDQIQIALNSVVRAQQLDVRPSAEVSEEFANVLWVQKEEKLAVQFLRHLIESDSIVDDHIADAARKAIWLSRLGTWTSEACLEKPAEIWDRYFDPSVKLLETVKENGFFNPSHATIYRQCAMFAERQYHAALKSPDVLRWKVYVERKQKEIQQLRSLGSSKDFSSEKNRAERLLKEDEGHFRKHNSLRDTSLKQAIDMYARCLQESNQFDSDSAIRFCSLWLANFDDESILPCVKTALERIPSRKLVFLAHQLTARLANAQSATQPETQTNLHKLILRICQEHPFHILYQVYCLSDHSTPTPMGRRQSGHQASQSTQSERGTVASTLLNRLRMDKLTSQRVTDLEKLCDAMLQWAKYPIKAQFANKQKGASLKVPNGCKILDILNLRVPVTTARTPLDPTLQYKDCVWIRRYDTTFDTAGGVNLPKINICHGSDGHKYKQLFKGEGEDDLRQDAVMEQVFELVNGVLKRDRETRRRDLKVRDYKVIPLASQAGIMEFVGNTSPLREWIQKAHLIYNPGDLKQNAISNDMRNLQKTTNNDPKIMLEFFLDKCKRFKPVMRHYFTQKHKNPINWFQMRLWYTRSIATTSIVGHVLGLGDRHTSNILLDNVSGEVVHIDLGIAFDQGKLLAIPEKVPFRMTADIVDGMGPSGTMGVFQRCAEETLRVLREESELIMTVLEVFKHDPLHSWTASEFKVKQAQSDVPAPKVATGNDGLAKDEIRFNLGIGIDMRSGSADEAADRALNSVARKLDKSLSVESTVNELLAEAMDPMNLATIFVGWFPFT
ncbi:hypothetical protein BDN70DRAFT_853086 [Pholiota conissans]|uniref:Serine/threonine-protein kinase Tel1 n=1 Tax=Pholiota conissans TaxID=109636 RepID=A0A9P6D3Y6_9AGAR|nr:hypothetical protein BDN70DRAFT_853086 [Pholiota conissans]